MSLLWLTNIQYDQLHGHEECGSQSPIQKPIDKPQLDTPQDRFSSSNFSKKQRATHRQIHSALIHLIPLPLFPISLSLPTFKG